MLTINLAYDPVSHQVLDPGTLGIYSGWLPQLAYAEQRNITLSFYQHRKRLDCRSFAGFRGALALTPENGGQVVVRLLPDDFKVTADGELQIAINTATAEFANQLQGRGKLRGILEIIACTEDLSQQRLAAIPILLTSLADPDPETDAPEMADLAVNQTVLNAVLANYAPVLTPFPVSGSAPHLALQESCRYVFSDPLDALVISDVPASPREIELVFTVREGFTLTLPESVGKVNPDSWQFEDGASYLLNIRNRLAVTAVYAPGE